MPRKFFVLLPIILPLIIFGFVLQAAPPRALGLIRGQGQRGQPSTFFQLVCGGRDQHGRRLFGMDLPHS